MWKKFLGDWFRQWNPVKLTESNSQTRALLLHHQNVCIKRVNFFFSHYLVSEKEKKKIGEEEGEGRGEGEREGKDPVYKNKWKPFPEFAFWMTNIDFTLHYEVLENTAGHNIAAM